MKQQSMRILEWNTPPAPVSKVDRTPEPRNCTCVECFGDTQTLDVVSSIKVLDDLADDLGSLERILGHVVEMKEEKDVAVVGSLS
jgi:hypothetical protein